MKRTHCIIRFQHTRLPGCMGIALLFLLLLPSLAQAQRMTLQQSVEDALGNSPEVLIARERVHQAREGVMETRGERRPQVDFSIEAGREFNTPAGGRERGETPGDYTTSYDATIGASQKLYDGTRTKSEIRRREELLEGTNFRATSIRHKVAQQMVETFLNIYQQQQALASVNIFVGRLEDLSAKMDLYAEEGNASKTLQKYVSSRLANAKQVRVQITNALQDSLESYTFLTQVPLDLSQTTLVMMRLPALEPFDSYRQDALTNNPEMKANLADLDAAKAELKKARGSFRPTVNLNTEYGDNRSIGGKIGQVRSASAMVEMRYKVYDGNTRDATLRRMSSQEKEKTLQVERTRRKNDQTLKSAWQTLSAKLEEEKLIRQELADTMDVRNLRQQEFEEGAGDLVQLVETEEKLFAAARQKLNVDTAILLNRFTLEFLTGKPHLSGTEEYLPFNPFDRLKSYSELLEKKAQVAPAVATTGSISDTTVVPESLPMPETEDISGSAVIPAEEIPLAETEPVPMTEVKTIEDPAVTEEAVSGEDVMNAAPAPVTENAPEEPTPVVEVPQETISPAPETHHTAAEVERLLNDMVQVEPAAGDQSVLNTEVMDTPLEEREALFPDYYLPRPSRSALALPETFDELPAPK